MVQRVWILEIFFEDMGDILGEEWCGYLERKLKKKYSGVTIITSPGHSGSESSVCIEGVFDTSIINGHYEKEEIREFVDDIWDKWLEQRRR